MAPDQRARAPRTGRTADVLLPAAAFPYLNIDRPAVADDGIRTLDERRVAEYAKRYDEFSQNEAHRKIRPASGAATRMFKSAVRPPESGVSDPATEEAPREPRQVRLRGRTAQQARQQTAPEKIIRRNRRSGGRARLRRSHPKRSSCFTATATGTAPRSRNTSAKGRSTPPTATGR